MADELMVVNSKHDENTRFLLQVLRLVVPGPIRNNRSDGNVQYRIVE